MITKIIRHIISVMQIKWLAWLLVLACMGTIFLLSHMDYVRSWHLTGKTLEVVQQSSDETAGMSYQEEVSYYSSDDNESHMLVLRKLAHMLEYFGLGLLSYNAFYSSTKHKKGIYGLFLAIAYAFVDEMHQLFVPGRDGSIRDVGIDSIGVVIGVLCISTLYRHFKPAKAVKG